ncbi:hypothetical protein GGR53DRAFT_476174 [Hypoxylon sp. FL1150]|nr:hypothetical protein GGR53DRAFT_476174 [Hypoxylon sp. FL1150]
MGANVDVRTAVGGVVSVLAIIFVALRFYSRHFTQTGYGWDDWMILLALLTIIATIILGLYASGLDTAWTQNNYGADPNHVYTPVDVIYNKLYFIPTVLYYTVTSATKLSILFMYMRFFSASKSFHRSVVVAIALVITFWTGCTIADLLSCIPLEWNWLNHLEDPQYCFNFNIFWMVSGIVEALIDVVIIVLPIRAVLGLHLSRTKKLAVLGVFLLGIFVIISGIVKVVLSYAPGSRNVASGDTEVWTTVHWCTGIICACLPVCWPIFLRLAKLSPSTWSVASSLRKRLYSFSGWSSINRGAQRTATRYFERSDNTTEGLELPIHNPENFSRAASL